MNLLCCNFWTIISSIGCFLSGLFTIFIYFGGREQIKKYIKLGELDLYYKLKKDFSSKETKDLVNSIIQGDLKCRIEKNGCPFLYTIRKDEMIKSWRYDLSDDLLTHFEDMFNFYTQKLISKKSISEGWGVLINKTFENETIQTYILELRKYYSDNEVYIGLKKLHQLINEKV